jgi:hypothetical protein
VQLVQLQTTLPTLNEPCRNEIDSTERETLKTKHLVGDYNFNNAAKNLHTKELIPNRNQHTESKQKHRKIKILRQPNKNILNNKKYERKKRILCCRI